MKYIDAEDLQVIIEKRINNIESCPFIEAEFGAEMRREGKILAYNDILTLIDSLQQEQPELPQIERAEYYYHKGVYEGLSQGRADALKMLDEFMKRQANPVIVIEQQEQPEVDLEKEYKEYVEDDPVFSKLINRNVGFAIARHFYELGLNARKEEEK